MHNLSTLSLVSLYLLLVIIGLYSLIVLVWQIRVLKGTAMKNADGSVDSWHEQKNFYGIALADILLACPLNLLAIVLVLMSSIWGYYLLAMVSFCRRSINRHCYKIT